MKKHGKPQNLTRKHMRASRQTPTIGERYYKR